MRETDPNYRMQLPHHVRSVRQGLTPARAVTPICVFKIWAEDRTSPMQGCSAADLSHAKCILLESNMHFVFTGQSSCAMCQAGTFSSSEGDDGNTPRQMTALLRESESRS